MVEAGGKKNVVGDGVDGAGREEAAYGLVGFVFGE